jgi:hypothetical protein
MKTIHSAVWGMAVLFTAVSTFAAVASDSGTSWLKIPASTRNAAMGEALVAVPDAVDAICINPAGLGLQAGMNASLAQNFWAQDLSIQHFSFTMGLANGTGFALGGDYVNFGNIPLYREVGSTLVSDGSYSPVGWNLYGGYGVGLWKGLRVGATAHYFYDDTQNNISGKTMALDAGLLYQVANTPFSASAVLSDLGGKLNDVDLPSQLKTGVSYWLDLGQTKERKDILTFAAEYDWGLSKNAKSAAGVGAEYSYERMLKLRAGYRFKNMDDLTGMRGLTCGVGLSLKSWEVDYALTTLGDFGTAHQIALNYRFGG